MCAPHGGCQPALGTTETVDSTWLAQLRREYLEFSHQRDLLAQGIADAAHKAGIIHDRALLDGPTLLMLLEDMAGCIERADAERKQLAAIVELTPELEADGETLVKMVTQAKNAATGSSVAWQEQCDRADKLEAQLARNDGTGHDKLMAAPVQVHQANVFLPGCIGPVRREVVLEDDYRSSVTALEGELDRVTALLKNPDPTSEVVNSMWLAELCARANNLEDEAAMRRNIEYAAEHLPAGWLIQISVEFEGSSVELINPDGEDVAFPTNSESLAQEVRDAVDALINPQPAEEEAPAKPDKWREIAEPVADADRLCHEPDCWCCDGTGRDPMTGGICKMNSELPF